MSGSKGKETVRIPRRILVLSVLIFVGATVLAASYQAEEGRFSLTPELGIQTGYSFGKLVPLPNTADVPEIDILLERGKPVWGLALGYRITPHFEIQGMFQYDRAEIVNDVGIGLTGMHLGKVKASDAEVFAYSGSVLYQLLSSRFSPYLSVGFGAVTLRTDQFGTATKLLLYFSGGTDIELTRRIHAVLDIRDSLHFFDFVKDFDFVYVQIYSPDMETTAHSLGVRLGLKFMF